MKPLFKFLSNNFKYLVYLTFFLLFFLRGITSLDPDFGWHMRLGEIISTSGIPETDPLSYTMPSYPFVDHEWLSNIYIYHFYNWFTYYGLAAFYALIAILALIVITPKANSKFTLPIFALSAVLLLGFAGVRTQVQTWLFFAIFLRLVLSNGLWSRYKYLAPILMVFWANLHGGFGIGLAILLIATTVKAWESKRLILSDWIVFSLSVSVTFINPYGWRIWWEIYQQLSDTRLHSTIAEWTPTIYRFNPVFSFLLGMSAFFFVRYFKKLTLLEKVYWGIFLLMGLSTSRHLPFWILINIPIIIKCLKMFVSDVKKVKLGLKKLRLIYKPFAGLIVGTVCLHLYFLFYGISFDLDREYPKEAINFLRTQRLEGEIFAPYGWGGYLDWKYPEKRVFIDGRMPSWRWDGPEAESDYAFVDYLSFGEKEKISGLINKYQISYILERKQDEPANFPKDQLSSWIRKRLGTWLVEPNRESFDKILKGENWFIIYRDSTSIIYKK